MQSPYKNCRFTFADLLPCQFKSTHQACMSLTFIQIRNIDFYPTPFIFYVIDRNTLSAIGSCKNNRKRMSIYFSHQSDKRILLISFWFFSESFHKQFSTVGFKNFFKRHRFHVFTVIKFMDFSFLSESKNCLT